MGVKAWKYDDPTTPKFPEDFDIVKKAVLQVTDIVSNHNKYYAIELHQKGNKFRVFTHYGRTDDLETNPNSGAKECRFADSLEEATDIYDAIYAQKTSARKGYQEVALASSKIGSQKARGTSSGVVDNETLKKISGSPKVPKTLNLNLAAPLRSLVSYLFSEAKTQLTSTVSATITANGIETPLGVLTVGQIEKGEVILDNIYNLIKQKKGNDSALEKLSGQFYTVIPHRIGRTREAIAAAVINSLNAFKQKQDTLQLMRDMLEVNGKGGVLYSEQIDAQYQSLNCEILSIDPKDSIYKEMETHSKGVRIKNIFRVKRPGEWSDFTNNIGNQKLLFHGSRVSNWVGLLSRGILLPKVVVKIGVNRTDEGWLGHGIYFGDIARTSSAYATPGKQGTSFMSIVRVALGKIKDYRKVTYGLVAPPMGFNSCHGVRGSEFYDDEFVIYNNKQQRMEYLVEFKG